MTKERLDSYKALKEEKAQLEALLLELEARKEAPPPRVTPESPRKARAASKPTEAPVVTTEEVRNYYRDTIADLDRELLAIEDAIRDLPPALRRIIRMHYIEGLPWMTIANRVHYSRQHLHRLHMKALSQMRKQ